MAVQSPVRLLAVYLFLHIWVPSACVERPGAHEALQVSLDKHGAAHMRREPAGASVHEDAFRSAKHAHHTQTHRAGMLVEEQPDGGIEEAFPAASSDSTGITYPSEEASGAQATSTAARTPVSTPEAKDNTLENVWDEETRDGTPPKTELGTAERKIEKLDHIIQAAEEKAGMPDSLKTTEEPQQLEPTEEEQEGTAMVIAVISIVVIIGAGSAGYSMWLQRQPEKNDQPLLRGEGQAPTQYTGEGARKGEEGYGDVPIKATHTAGSVNTVLSAASKSEAAR